MFFSLNCVWGLNHLILPLFCLFYETQMFLFFFLRSWKRGALLSKLRSEMMQMKVSNCGFWNFFPSNPATDSTTACNRKKKKTCLSAWFFYGLNRLKVLLSRIILKARPKMDWWGHIFILTKITSHLRFNLSTHKQLWTCIVPQEYRKIF